MAKKVHQMQQQPKVLDAAILAAFFNGTDAQKTEAKVAELEGSRLNWLVRHFDVSEVADVQKATKEMKAGAAEAEKKTVAVRASEVQTLFGAYKFADWKPDGMGYHKAVETARKELKARNIRWNGGAIPDAIQKAVRKEARTNAAAFEEAEIAKRRAEAAGKPLSEDEVEAVREKTLAAIERRGAHQMAATLYKRKGAEFCGWLIEALEAKMAEGVKDQAEQEKQQKAA